MLVDATRPSNAPAQAATRRQRPAATNMRARKECHELEPRYQTNEVEEIYAEMDN